MITQPSAPLRGTPAAGEAPADWNRLSRMTEATEPAFATTASELGEEASKDEVGALLGEDPGEQRSAIEVVPARAWMMLRLAISRLGTGWSGTRNPRRIASYSKRLNVISQRQPKGQGRRWYDLVKRLPLPVQDREVESDHIVRNYAPHPYVMALPPSERMYDFRWNE